MRVALALMVCTLSGTALADFPLPTNVPDPSPKMTGTPVANEVSPELRLSSVVQGNIPLENPTNLITYYAYLNDGPLLPAAGDLPSANHHVEASKTEPDKNLYLVLHGQHGADLNYNYGSHFLFQGHEAGAGYFTRVNLDADLEHRVTLMASADANGNPLPSNWDGITWDPWAKRILLTAEGGGLGGPWQATLDFPSKVEWLVGSMGTGGSEGIQNDELGNVWIVEDASGAAGSQANALTHAKQPNSFIFRFVPVNNKDLTRGRLEALQVMSNSSHMPIVFHANDIDGDIINQDRKDLHTYGVKFDARWVTVHDTDVDGNNPFDANAAAKNAGATPFKRPENGVFRPGSEFRDFFFTETGDTTSLTEAGSAYGGFGGIYRFHQKDVDEETGTLSVFYVGDVAHTGLDNIAFWDNDHVIAVEDCGDGLHAQRNALDSAYMFNTHVNYGNGTDPVRVLAEGRDAAATLDSGFLGMTGFQNEGDNEITGIHISNGDASKQGILGAQFPVPFVDGWRVFFTQQHGENYLWEILPKDP